MLFGNEILIGVPALISDWCMRIASFVHTATRFRSRLYLLKKYFTRTPANEKLNRINSDFIFSARSLVAPWTQMRYRLNLIIAARPENCVLAVFHLKLEGSREN